MDIWTEKYRPKNFEEFVNQKDIVERVKAFVEKEALPHQLFAGPAGVGKTTLSSIIARSLFGDSWKRNYLELNASDERGIDTIRNKVKDFARSKAFDSDYKIIALDEADALTKDAQQALRRTMENYSRTCRFILICNWSSKIIEPIQSRCAVFRFKPLKSEDIESHLKDISEKEDVEIDDKGLDTIVKVSEGDIRRSINVLQSAASTGKPITEELVYDITAKARPESVTGMLENALNGSFKDSREALYKSLIEDGLSGEEIIKEIHRQIHDADITEERKIRIIEKIGDCEFRINEGSNQQIQLEALLASISLLG